MGMAASQARFLSLTARKSNVEYQGQQINQQRTALANESSNLYEQLTNLEVPTPPSVEDYTKMEYTFSSKALSDDGSTVTYTLGDLVSTPDGMQATLIYDEDTSGFVTMSSNAYQGTGTTKDSDGNSYSYVILNGSRYTLYEDPVQLTSSLYSSLTSILGDVSSLYTTYASTTLDADDYTDGYAVQKVEISEAQYNAMTATDESGAAATSIAASYDEDSGKYYAMALVKSGEDDEDDTVISYLADGSYTGNDESGYSLLGDEIEAYNESYWASDVCTSTNGTLIYGDIETGVFAQYVTSSKTATTSASVTYVETNDVGRMTSIQIELEDGTTQTYSLTCTEVEDEDAYDQAMLDYEYQKAVYNNEYETLNAKTESIQEKDKKLELKLKQVDTEQDAISTEMDAVSKVVEDNIESTFKTFG